LNKKRIITEVAEYYDDKLKVHGATPKGVDWNSLESQELRFVQLLKLININSSDFSILDFGCGLGDLLKFIESLKFHTNYQYSGYDISEEMISRAKERNKNFIAEWISHENILSEYNYAVASGIFNVKQNNETKVWEAYILETLNQMNELSTDGFAFNMLTSYSDEEYMKDYLYYADPAFYFDFCKKNFSQNIALLHDYNLYEFTIIVRKHG